MVIHQPRWFGFIPSGKRLQFVIWKWPIEIDGLPNLTIVIFYSYVKLPEGIWKIAGTPKSNSLSSFLPQTVLSFLVMYPIFKGTRIHDSLLKSS